jgi:hypothetical protein
MSKNAIFAAFFPHRHVGAPNKDSAGSYAKAVSGKRILPLAGREPDPPLGNGDMTSGAKRRLGCAAAERQN